MTYRSTNSGRHFGKVACADCTPVAKAELKPWDCPGCRRRFWLSPVETVNDQTFPVHCAPFCRQRHWLNPRVAQQRRENRIKKLKCAVCGDQFKAVRRDANCCSPR